MNNYSLFDRKSHLSGRLLARKKTICFPKSRGYCISSNLTRSTSWARTARTYSYFPSFKFKFRRLKPSSTVHKRSVSHGSEYPGREFRFDLKRGPLFEKSLRHSRDCVRYFRLTRFCGLAVRAGRELDEKLQLVCDIEASIYVIGKNK